MQSPAFQTQPPLPLSEGAVPPPPRVALLKPLAHFDVSPFCEAGETLVHSTATPFRIDRGSVGFWCGLNKAQSGLLDHAAGSDLIWWTGGLDSPATQRLAVWRNSIEPHPLTGKNALMMKFPAGGGFVPPDHLLSDGRPHPGAGTGFAMCHVVAVPLEVFEDSNRAENGTWGRGETVYRCLEVRQIRFEAGAFTISEARRHHFDEMFPGWLVQNGPLGSAVVDGSELVWPVACVPDPRGALDRFDAKGSIGLSRWGFRDGAWSIHSLVPIAADFCGYEPSIIRDKNGRFSLTARITGAPESWDKFGIPVWNSTDGGAHWQEAFRAERHRANSPVTIGATASGRPFILGNLMVGGMNQRSLGYSRELLALWLLRPDGSGLESAQILRCGQLDFGPAPTQHGWKIDHPISTVVEDADGREVCLLTYRVQSSDENKLKEVGRSPFSGTFVEKLLIP